MENKIQELRFKSATNKENRAELEENKKNLTNNIKNPHHIVPNVLHANTRQEASSPQKIIAAAVERRFPQVGENAKNEIARQIVIMPHGKQVKIGDEPVKVEDLQYLVAESIDIYCAGTSRKYEYHEYIEDAKDIISDMNTNGVTVEELDTRNQFISDTYQRENEIITCLGLYRASKFPDAEVKYKELYTKLQKIREVRSAILASTKNVADKFDENAKVIENDTTKTEQEKEKEKNNLVIYPKVAERAAMGAMIIALHNYENLSVKEKIHRGFYHPDVQNGLNPDMAQSWLYHQLTGMSVLEEKIHENKHENEDSLKKRILDLRFSRAKFGAIRGYQEDENELEAQRKSRTFDPRYYEYLQQNQRTA